jgi:hypothetical protein
LTVHMVLDTLTYCYRNVSTGALRRICCTPLWTLRLAWQGNCKDILHAMYRYI